MLELNKDAHREPIGGHQFPSHGIMFRSDTFKELVEKLKTFRLVNGLKLGNPEQEILQHYAKNWPFLVKQAGSEEVHEGNTLDAWRMWVYDTWNDPPKKYIVEKEARERMAICAICEYRMGRPEGSKEEVESIDRRAFLLRKGIAVDEKIKFCACHLWDIPIASLIDDPKKYSNQPKDEGCPPNCWVGK